MGGPGGRRRLRTGPGCEAVAGPNHLSDQRTPRFPDWAAGDEAVAGRFLISGIQAVTASGQPDGAIQLSIGLAGGHIRSYDSTRLDLTLMGPFLQEIKKGLTERTFYPHLVGYNIKRPYNRQVIYPYLF